MLNWFIGRIFVIASPKHNRALSQSAFRPLVTVECFEIRILIQVRDVTVNGKRGTRFFFRSPSDIILDLEANWKLGLYKHLVRIICEDIEKPSSSRTSLPFFNISYLNFFYPLCSRNDVRQPNSAAARCLLAPFFGLAYKSRWVFTRLALPIPSSVCYSELRSWSRVILLLHGIKQTAATAQQNRRYSRDDGSNGMARSSRRSRP